MVAARESRSVRPDRRSRRRLLRNGLLGVLAVAVILIVATSAGSPTAVATPGWSIRDAGFSTGSPQTQKPGTLLYVSGPVLTNRSSLAATVVAVEPHIVGTGLVYIDTRTYDAGSTIGVLSWSPGGSFPEPIMVPDSALVGTVLEPGVAPPLNRMMRFLVIDRTPTHIDGVDVTYRQLGRLWTQRMRSCYSYGADSMLTGTFCS